MRELESDGLGGENAGAAKVPTTTNEGLLSTAAAEKPTVT
jgi:hypothetical protein